MIRRNLVHFPNNTSFFLFGPRQTGKTTALLSYLKEEQKSNYWMVNLLQSKSFLAYEKDPSQFSRDALYQIEKQNVQTIFVDEVQKIPILLDEIHQLIESHKNVHFILSGSSARKLKKGGANLLGGRAVVRYLFPLTHTELEEKFDLDLALTIGTLPGIYFDPIDLALDKLRSYTEIYLKEEIFAEALIRNIGDFHRFLEVAAQHTSEIINYENISRESATKGKTVKGYFQVLEDTLIGHTLPAWDQSVRKQLSLHPKFYFFDNGVVNGILGSLDGIKFPEFRGKLFEQWLINEIRAYIFYSKKPIKMHFWRTQAGTEVDLVLSKSSRPFAALEFKAQKEIGKKHLSGIKSFSEEYSVENKILVYEGVTSSIYDGIEILSVKTFLSKRLQELIYQF